MDEAREDERQVCPCGDETHAPPAVLDALASNFPKDFQTILLNLAPHVGAFDRFWSFNRWGMFVGIEPDGYIHS